MENSLVLHNSFPVIKNFANYKSYVLNIPNLSEKEERDLLIKFKVENSLKSAQTLILSQLKTQERLNELLKKIHFATFGSIYITPMTGVDMVHYIAVGDVANTVTWGFQHRQQITRKELENYKKLKDYNISYQKRQNIPIYDICFYSKN